MRYRQFDLVTDSGAELVCWLRDDRRLTRGRRITLRGDDRVWRIRASYSILLDEPPHQDWQVGGIL
jgi:hypothetical protein